MILKTNLHFFSNSVTRDILCAPSLKELEGPVHTLINILIHFSYLNKSSQFAQAYELALGIIGSRRERLAHEGMLNAQIVRETMPLYDPMCRKWLINEKNNDEHTGQTKFITIEIPTRHSCPDGSHKDEYDKIFAKEKLKEQEIRQLGRKAY